MPCEEYMRVGEIQKERRTNVMTREKRERGQREGGVKSHFSCMSGTP